MLKFRSAICKLSDFWPGLHLLSYSACTDRRTLAMLRVLRLSPMWKWSACREKPVLLQTTSDPILYWVLGTTNAIEDITWVFMFFLNLLNELGKSDEMRGLSSAAFHVWQITQVYNYQERFSRAKGQCSAIFLCVGIYKTKPMYMRFLNEKVRLLVINS